MGINLAPVFNALAGGIQQHRIKKAFDTYQTDPAAGVNMLYKVDPNMAMQLADKMRAQTKEDQATKASHLSTITTMLRGARDGGKDIGAAYTALTPALKALGLKDDEISQWGSAISANPDIIDGLDTEFNKTRVVGPGSAVVRGGKELYHAPFKPDRPLVLKPGDTAYDPNASTDEDGNPLDENGEPADDGPHPLSGDAISPAPADPFAGIISRGERSPGQFDKNGNPLTSPKGAIGIAQVMPTTGPEAAAYAGVSWDPDKYRHDAAYNEKIGRAYHAVQLARFGGDEAKAAAAYNAGPGRVARVTGGDGGAASRAWLKQLPAETRAYVQRVAPGVFGDAGGASVGGSARMGGGGKGKVLYTAPGKPLPPDAKILSDPKWLKANGFSPGTVVTMDTKGNYKVLQKPNPQTAAGGKFSVPMLKQRTIAAITELQAVRRQLHSVLEAPGLDASQGTMAGRTPDLRQKSVNYANRLDTLHSMLTLRKLQDLRANSPTGGALGNVSDKDVALLRDSAAQLQRTNDPKEQRRILNQLDQDLAATTGRLSSAFREQVSGMGGGGGSSNGGWSIEKED